MDKTNLLSQYTAVCDAPSGVGFQIDHMPEFFALDPMDNCQPHVHTFYEVIWFQEGGGVHYVDFKEYPIEANTLFFLSPGQVHYFDSNTHRKGVLMKFCTDFIADEKGSEDIFIKYHVFNAFDALPFYRIVDEQVVESLKFLMESMESEWNRVGEFGHRELLMLMVRMFMINVVRYGKRDECVPINTTKASHLLFVRFRKMLEQHFDEYHTVGDYAQKLNVSNKTLSNAVLECSRKTPLAFINDRIVLEAKRLIRFTDMRIREVAFRLGYEDPSYFVKFFKRETGYLPMDFKQTGNIQLVQTECATCNNPGN